MLEATRLVIPTGIIEIFEKAVKDRISEFNKTRSRRKILNPIFTTEAPDFHTTHCLKFGIISLPDTDISAWIEDVANATVFTLLHVKPRPGKVNFHILTRDGELKYALMVHKTRRSRKEWQV